MTNQLAQFDHGFLRECESLAVQLAPELSAAPVYVTTSPPNSLKTDALAYAPIGVPDFPVRDQLIASGRWMGPGTTVVFCEAMERPVALGIFVHELAHHLPFSGVRHDIEPTAELRLLQRLHVETQT